MIGISSKAQFPRSSATKLSPFPCYCSKRTAPSSSQLCPVGTNSKDTKVLCNVKARAHSFCTKVLTQAHHEHNFFHSVAWTVFSTPVSFLPPSFRSCICPTLFIVPLSTWEDEAVVLLSDTQEHIFLESGRIEEPQE